MNTIDKKIIKKITHKICRSLEFSRQNLHEPVFGAYEKKYVNKCLDSGFVSSAGKMIGEFENKIKKITKSKYAISVTSCTEAIKISLIVAGVEKNQEVLVPSLTFVGSVSPIVQIGAVPHFVDSDIGDLGIDLEKMRDYLKKNIIVRGKKAINKKTGRIIKAIIPVHIFGHPCRIDEIVELCKNYRILVIEDAAEALGSQFKKRHVGTFGLAGCISFNGNKIITTGSGGMILTDNKKFAKKAKHLIQTAKKIHKYEFIHDEIGYNLRMPNLNASLGLGQVKNLNKFLLLKRKLYLQYKNNLADLSELTLFSEKKLSKSNYWLQTIVLNCKYKNLKNALIEKLNMKGVNARPAWKLISSLKPYAKFPKMNLSGANNIYSRVVNLPSGPGILLKLMNK